LRSLCTMLLDDMLNYEYDLIEQIHPQH